MKGVSFPVQTYCVEGLVNKSGSKNLSIEQNLPGFSMLFNPEQIDDKELVKQSLTNALNQLA